jgi:hypothetical protein
MRVEAQVRQARPKGIARRALMALLALVSGTTILNSESALAAKPHGVAGVAVPFPPGPIVSPPVVPPQFDITGFIQEATLDTTGLVAGCTATDPRLAGGTLKVDDITITVPCNTVLQMPATALSWADLFHPDLVPVGTPLGASGLALADGPYVPPLPSYALPGALTATTYNGQLPSYEVHVQGNIINGRYIAALIFISQQSANAATGIINFIDYATATIHVGGPLGAAGPNDVLLRLNDPVGRYGVVHAKVGACAGLGLPAGQCVEEVGYDPRFTSDTNNPTIRSVTGYPMCVPRFDPASGVLDPECPWTNRPISAGPTAAIPACASVPGPFTPFVQPAAGQYCTTFMMPPPAACAAQPCPPDPTKQAPFEVGDYVSYAGTLKVDPLTGPYISTHTLLDNVGIYTTPGVAPAYVGIDVLLAGTSPLPVQNLPQETTSKVKLEGFATDPTALVDLYAVDVDPISGAQSTRLLGTEDPGQPPVLGRWRFRPRAGAFLPPTREIRAVSRNSCGNNLAPCDIPGFTPAAAAPTANGLTAGEYQAPDFEFIFAENLVVGDPTVPANPQDLAFLFCGSGPLGLPVLASGGPTTTPVVGQLNPVPWAPPQQNPLFFGTGNCVSGLANNVVPLPVAGVLPFGATDTVTINTAQWVNRNNRGKLNVVASSSLPATTPGLQLYVTAYALATDGVTHIPLAPTPQPMSIVMNIPGTPPVCPVDGVPCWQFLTDGVFIDPTSTAIYPATGAKAFVPVTSITVTDNATPVSSDTVPNTAVAIVIRP